MRCCSGLYQYENFEWMDTVDDLDCFFSNHRKALQTGCLAFFPCGSMAAVGWTARLRSLHMRACSCEVSPRYGGDGTSFLARDLFDRCIFIWVDDYTSLKVRSCILCHWPPLYVLKDSDAALRIGVKQDTTATKSGFLALLHASKKKRLLVFLRGLKRRLIRKLGF